MNLGRLLEACQVDEKVGLEHSSKSTKHELESSYGDLVHEQFYFSKTVKLKRECNDVIQTFIKIIMNIFVALSRQFGSFQKRKMLMN